MNKAIPCFYQALILPLMLFICPVATGQHSGLFFQNYTTVNGLCDNSVNSITQDSRGFIWIGTAEGLSRFDGISFRNYYGSRDSSQSFSNANISNLTEYKTHHLIFSSLGKLWCLNTLTNTFYRPPAELSNRFFSLIATMPGGKILLSCADTAFIVDQDFKITHRIGGPAKDIGINAYPISADTLLLTNGKEHYLYGISSEKLSPFNTHPKFKEAENISMFLGTAKSARSFYFSNYWQGLYEYRLDGRMVNHYTSSATDSRKSLSHNGVHTLFHDNDSIVYIASFNGLSILNKRNGIVSRYFKQSDNSNSIAGDIVTTIFKDRSGNFWIGTTEGLSKLAAGNHGVEITGSVDVQKLNHEIIRLSKGNGPWIYASSLGGGTYRINRLTNTMDRFDSTMVSSAWSAMPSGNLVLLGGGGGNKLVGYNNSTGEWIVPDFLNPYYGNADILTLMYRDSHGDEWYSLNQGSGLIRKPADGKALEHYSKKLPVPSFSLSYLADATEDPFGNSWFGVNKTRTLLHWNYKTRTFKEMLPDTIPGAKGMTFAGSSCLYADKQGMLWISYEGAGLLAYDIAKHTAQLYSIEDGLPTNYIHSITADDRQRLWLGTAKGLVCFLPGEKKFITFKKENGLPAQEFGYDAGYFDPISRSLWLACKEFILRINPDNLIQQTKSNFAIYSDEIRINGSMLDKYGTNSFSHKENNFQFQFTAVDIDNGKDLEFSYKLRGADDDWIYAGDKRSAIYSSLGPGDYTFTTKARRKGDTKWIEMQEPFSFTIATPWWQSWWFRVLVACAFVGAVIISVRRYFQGRLEKQRAVLERQQAIEKERTRIATDMHDDFGASLSRIKFLSEKIQLGRDNPEKTNEDLGKISAFSDEMAEKMGEIVWALNQRYDSSGDMISFCRSYASEYLGDKNIKLQFDSSEVAEINVNGEIRRNIFLVVKESLHNIVKHSKASEVRIRIDIDNELRVLIHDNGKGFDAASIRPFADGMQNMKKRIEEIGGRFSVDGTQGTKIEIHVRPGIQQNTYR